jgi:hypothetical protein
MQKRSDVFPARLLVTTFVVVWLSVGLAAAAARTPPAASPGLAHATASPAPAGQATGLAANSVMARLTYLW